MIDSINKEDLAGRKMDLSFQTAHEGIKKCFKQMQNYFHT